MNDTGPQGRADSVFVVLPEWVLDAEVSDRAVRLYAVLRRYADSTHLTAWPSRATLAERVRCSLDSVDRAMKELIAVGALSVRQRRGDDGSLTSNLYTLRSLPPLAASVRLGSREAAATLAAPVRHELEPSELETPLTPTGVGEPCSRHEPTGRRHPSCRACGTSPRAVAAAARRHRPPWCGSCDERTRLVDHGAVLARCPACHPLEVAP